MSATPVIQVREVSVGYGGEPVLHRLSVELRQGEWVALVGPNGSGKSTLLRTCGRLLRPQEGTVLLHRRDLFGIPTREVAREVALLPQGPSAPTGLSVRELVELGRHPHRGMLSRASTADREAVDEALDLTGLRGFADRSAADLSGGERQRVWMALVLAQQTPTLLLDEPTTFLDLGHQWELLELVDDLRSRRQMSVLIVLHDLNQAAQFCDRLVALHQGQVVADGAAHEVITDDLLRTVFGIDATVLLQDQVPVVIPRRSVPRP